MLITLFAWIYISFLCWIWGRLVFRFLQKISDEEFPVYHFTFVCIIGLSAITVVAGIFSLFIPLSNWWVQLIFLAPALLFLLKIRPAGFSGFIRQQLSVLHPLSFLLLLILLLMILVMSTWIIVHPDTLSYHAQTIQWIEKYKAVTGLVHLHVRFGYQGLWFVSEALFGFSFSGIEGITFLNSTVIAWFIFFVISRINYNFFEEGKHYIGFLWTGLLLLSFWSYTQLRLTAASASPDFIATLFTWTIVYLLIHENSGLKKYSFGRWLLIALLSITSFTIKLAAAPVLIFVIAAIIIFLKQKRIKLLFTALLISAIILFPFIARNIISSGYMVFPSSLIDVTRVDWKYNPQLTELEKDYITAYAKKPGISHSDDVKAIAQSQPAQWLPGWWQHQSAADKTIIILLLLSLAAAFAIIKKIVNSGFRTIIVFITLLIGIFFWFFYAPDPRFGFGTIIGFISATAYLLIEGKKISLNTFLPRTILLIVLLITSSYIGYRFANFFEKQQWLIPLGIKKIEYSSFDCNGIKINKPIPGNNFGNIPVPCTDLDCDIIIPRGKKISDGFRAIENQ